MYVSHWPKFFMGINAAHPPKPVSYTPWLPHLQMRKLTQRLSRLHHLSATKGRGEGLSHYTQNQYLPASPCFLPSICLLCVIFFPIVVMLGWCYSFSFRTRLTYSSHLPLSKSPYQSSNPRYFIYVVTAIQDSLSHCDLTQCVTQVTVPRVR